MKLTRRQLRKIINEAVALNEQATNISQAEALAGNLTPEQRKAIIDQIDWERCNLPDGVNWNKYTQASYKVSERNRSNPTVANEQFIGCITVPLRWTILSETAEILVSDFRVNVSPGSRHDLDAKYDSGNHRPLMSLEISKTLETEIKAYSTPEYKSFQEYYMNIAQGTKIHAKEFNETYLNNFIDLLREALKTSRYGDLASRTGDHEKILRQIEAAFIRMERDKTSEYMRCIEGNEDLYEI